MSLNNEKITQTKICKKCNSSFDITDRDIKFYDKISPKFGDKKYTIPTPTLCPECIQQRKLTFRNERNLYKRKCDLIKKEIISIYSPNKSYKVYNREDWWSDKWNALDYGKDFNFNKSFFEQFKDFSSKIPKQALHTDATNEKCEYLNYGMYNKNCYLSFSSVQSEDCLYSQNPIKCIKDIDGYYNISCQFTYECIHCNNGYELKNCIYSNDCKNSYFLFDCISCENCFGCVNLRHKEYFFLNKEFKKEEYYNKIKNIIGNPKKLEEFKNEYKNILLKYPRKSARNINSENCTGDFIQNSKNSDNCFVLIEGENCKDCYVCGFGSHIQSCLFGGMGNWIYDSIGIANSNNCSFGIYCRDNIDCFYCISSDNCKNCFACEGLMHKEYCILNKQYTKTEYNRLVPKIIEHMEKTGEWGEFFLANISTFGYNETIASEYFPLKKEEAIKQGFNWSTYEAPFPKVDKIIPADKLPNNIKDIPDDILNWAIKCEKTQKPFKIISQELEFYRKHDLQVPKRHPDQRHLDRMALRNPRKLFLRKCDKCGVDMNTTYASDRVEIVYCEKCYNEEVY